MFSTKSEITQNLFNLQDIAYRDFQAKLIPTVASETVIGVRTPALRAFAKQLIKDGMHTQIVINGYWTILQKARE